MSVEEKKQDPNDPDEIAKRLRDKIRLQAEELLNKVDNLERSRNDDSNNKSNSVIDNNNNNNIGSIHNSNNNSNSNSRNITILDSPAGRTSEGSNNNNNNELTKRLQKLAIERNKLLNSNKDRLRVIQSDTSSHLSSIKTFQELNLPKHLLDSIFHMGFNRPSTIQEAALPRILAGRNVIGQAQSGSGKTAAFCLGMLYRIDIDNPATTQAVCVTPTRELAIQIVEKAVTPIASNMTGFICQLAISQVKERSVDAHLVVGTPGKLCDWIKRKKMYCNKIKVFVLDEADHMVAESGHRANSILLKKQMPKNCQFLLFSATFPEEVVTFASKLIPICDKILIENGPEYLVLDVIKQLWVDTREYHGGKLEFLADIYSLLTIGQSIVFVGTKNEADAIHNTLTASGYTCSVLHGSVDPKQRDLVMSQFRNNQSNVLITTNVLARGVDVDNVCLVINYDIPVNKDNEPDYETYLHRIGRTGRFGRKGTAINLISDTESLEKLAAIEKYFAIDNKEMITQVQPDPEALADVIEI